MDPLRENPFNVPMAEGVGRMGFRKWYERELLSSHAHMVLAVFCTIGIVASVEAMEGADDARKLMNVLFILLFAAVGAWSLRRYMFLLMRAEELASQAVCSDCGSYGRFRVVADHRARNETQVECERCSHAWIISNT